jgi:hypothetical protein
MSPMSGTHRPDVGWKPVLGVLGLTAGVFVVACALPALVVQREGDPPETWPGYQLLWMGPMAPLIGQFGWFAHAPAAVGAFALLVRWFRAAAALAALAILIGLQSLMLFQQPFPANEGGVGPDFVTQAFGAGFYVWLTSFAVLLVGSLVLRAKAAHLS